MSKSKKKKYKKRNSSSNQVVKKNNNGKNAKPIKEKITEEKQKENERKESIIGLTIFCLFIVGIIALILCSAFKDSGQPQVEKITRASVEDPFDFISVEYSGINGEGTVEITKIADTADVIDVDNIDFFCAAENVSNGDIITVTANSDVYDLKTTSKEYPVNGLNDRVTSGDEITANIYDNLFTSMESYKKEIISADDTIPMEITKFEPSSCYLAQGENDSFIINIAKVSIKSNGRTYTNRYVGMEGLSPAITEDGDLHFQDGTRESGNEISLGKEDGTILGFNNINEVKAYIQAYVDSGYVVTEINK